MFQIKYDKKSQKTEFLIEILMYKISFFIKEIIFLINLKDKVLQRLHLY